MAPEVRLVQSPLGYFEVNPKPSPEELAAYYADRYYSAGRERSQYAYAYTPDELEHHRLVADETLRYVGSGPGRVYEVGFGEGFALAAFQDHGWDVGGIDFTSDGLETHNPALRDRVDIGDVFEELDRLTGSGRQFDVVLCNNVLEHVLDPERLATSLLGLVAPAGICRIVVPNDGSFLQREIVRRGYAEPDFWVRYPDHLNYFTVESLAAVLTASGWEIVDLLGSFPVDVFLFNPDSNYEQVRERGRNCHFARVAVELALAQRGMDALVAFRRGCAQAGLGRDLVAYVRKSS